MKALVFAEKPSVAKEMARVLHANMKHKGYFEGKDYIITWALGHLATLFEPADYDKKYMKWDMAMLPMIPDKMKIKRLAQTSQQFKTVNHLMNRKDIKELIIATDAGREGELVARWTMMLAGFKKPFRRLWISSQTDKAIKDGFNNLKNGREYDRLFHAASCRAEADWLIGLNLTRALTCKFNSQLSAGRVQTPTLNMIVQREAEIKSFKPVPFWEIKVEFDGYFGNWRSKDNNSGKIFDLDYAEKMKTKFGSSSGKVVDVEIKDKQKSPPLAYDLTELQREANKRYGFSAKKTLSLMQILYERYKILTYPRTDSRYITTDIVETLKERLIHLKNSSYGNLASKILSRPINPGKRFVDNSKVSDHHAIIPTEERADYSKLSSDERKIYDLVVRRFLAVLLPSYKYKELKIQTEIDGEYFYSKGKEIISLGWKEVSGENYEENENEQEILPEQSLRSVKKGENLKVKKISLIKSNTRPPARLNEGTLLSKMEKGKLGTPATRADIIEKILSSFYVERNGRELVPTSKGKQLIGLVPEMIKSADLTAKWEKELELISLGKSKPQVFLDGIKVRAKELIETVKAMDVEFKLDNLTKESCPMCGKKMLKVKGKKKQEMLVCQDRECGYRENIKRKGDNQFSVSKHDKVMNKKLINQYSDKTESSGMNLGDLLKDFIK